MVHPFQPLTTSIQHRWACWAQRINLSLVRSQQPFRWESRNDIPMPLDQCIARASDSLGGLPRLQSFVLNITTASTTLEAVKALHPAFSARYLTMRGPIISRWDRWERRLMVSLRTDALRGTPGRDEYASGVINIMLPLRNSSDL